MTKLRTAFLGSFLTLHLTGCAGVLPQWAGNGIPDGDLTDGPNAGELPQDPKLGVIRGKVVDAQGRPVQGAKVMVYKPTQRGGAVQGYRVMASQDNWLPPVYISETTTGRDGIFQAINAPPGHVTVEVRDPSTKYGVVTGNVPTTPSEESGPTELPPMIPVRVADMNGVIVGTPEVNGLVALPNTRFATTLEATTSFAFESLPVGFIVESEVVQTETGKMVVTTNKGEYEYQISLEREGKPTKLSHKMAPQPGDQLDITFNLGATVAGKVQAGPGVDLTRLVPLLRIYSGWASGMVPGTLDVSTGEFRFEEIPTDEYFGMGSVAFQDSETHRFFPTYIGEGPNEPKVNLLPNDQGFYWITYPEWPVRVVQP